MRMANLLLQFALVLQDVSCAALTAAGRNGAGLWISMQAAGKKI